MEFSATFWLVLVLTGIGAGLSGGVLMRLLYAAQHVAWSEGTAGLYTALVDASAGRKILVLGTAGLLVAIVGYCLGSVKGGHAGELSVAIWFHAGGMPLVRTLGRAVLSIVIVAMGGGRWKGRCVKADRRGSLVGAGAHFGRALAGAEAIADRLRRRGRHGCGLQHPAWRRVVRHGSPARIDLPAVRPVPAIACSVLATATSWLLLPMHPAYATPAYILSLNQIGWAGVVGPMIGGVSVLYVRLIAWPDLHQPRSLWSKVLAPIVVFAGLGAVAIVFPELLGNGKDVVQLTFIGGRGDATLGAPWLLLALVPMRAIATALCLRSGAPGGLFTPTMACGALLGGGLGRLWGRLFHADAFGSYAVIGSGAFLAAASEGPVSAVVTVLELGQTVSLLIVPLLVTVAGATLVTRICDSPSIYSARLQRGAARATKSPSLQAGEFSDLISQDFATISAAANPAIALQQLVALQDRPVPRPLYVIDEKGRLAGRISPGSIRRHDDARRPIEMSTASDLAESIQSISDDLSREDAMHRLAKSDSSELPVSSAQTGEFAGVLRAP